MTTTPEALLRESFGRREFLRRGGGGLLLALGGVLPGCGQAGGNRVNGAGTFSNSERLTLRAICQRLLPGGRRAPDAAATEIAEKIETLVSDLGPHVAVDFKRLLSLFDWSPILFEARSGRFSTLSPDTQSDVIRGWATSRLGFRRSGFTAIKRLAMSIYYAQEGSWPAIGFPGPWLQS